MRRIKENTIVSLSILLILGVGCFVDEKIDEDVTDSGQMNMDSGHMSTDSGINDTEIDMTDAIFENRSEKCSDYANTYFSEVQDVKRTIDFKGNLNIAVSDNKCVFSSNAIPNHDFNNGNARFANDVSEQSQEYSVSASPTMANENTSLSLMMDNAVFLNGVKLDLLAAACHGVGDEKIGCFDIEQPWRFDPMSPLNTFGTDDHHAHTQPDGTYHYHGSPMAMFKTDEAIISPVIGFAADGFPIFGTYFDDAGTVRKAKSSYKLKEGARVAIKDINPGGDYDGQYVDDFEYDASYGDLDECNGMVQNGVYGYYITESYPWVLRCFKGEADSSFQKSMGGNRP